MRSTSAAVRTVDPTSCAAIDRTHALSTVNVAEACGPLDYAIVSTRDGFDALATEWDTLFARAGHGSQLFQTFGWCWHWCNHYLDGDQTLAIATGRREGRLVLVWPLVVNRLAGLVQLTAMGDPVSQYSDALLEPSPDAALQLEGAWRSLLAQTRPDLVLLPHVRADAAIAPIMNALGGLVAQRQWAPYVDLGSEADDAAVSRLQSSRLRKKQRAAARRLAKLGAISFSEHSDSAQSSALAADAVDMKRHQLAERGLLSPTFSDRRLRAFFADAALGHGHDAGARMLALDCNGERAAIDILVACKDRIATHIVAYDPRFSKENVGWQLLNHAIATAHADGYRTFDLLAPADPYKLRWADGSVEVIDWVLPVSMKGALYARLYPMLARPLLKRLARALPQWLTRVVAGRYYRRATS
jgi:CelD/BcsL family acetyltransferase involved in cellulose biosynthesis